MTVSGNPLSITAVPVDADCMGDRWETGDFAQLGRLVAIVAMGQAAHAAQIVQAIRQAEPAISHPALIKAATFQLQITGANDTARDASRWRRDGFIFETISWIAAHQTKTGITLLKDPHIKSTTQGIDGLVIELDKTGREITRATVVEDKCSGDPRKMFRDEVMPAFECHHANTRGPELISTAASLIEKSGMAGSDAVLAAARVLDREYRRYQAALAVEKADDTQPRRAAIFKGYNELAEIAQHQRVASTFIVEGKLRDYFDTIAASAIAHLAAWKLETVHV